MAWKFSTSLLVIRGGCYSIFFFSSPCSLLSFSFCRCCLCGKGVEEVRKKGKKRRHRPPAANQHFTYLSRGEATLNLWGPFSGKLPATNRSHGRGQDETCSASGHCAGKSVFFCIYSLRYVLGRLVRILFPVVWWRGAFFSAASEPNWSTIASRYDDDGFGRQYPMVHQASSLQRDAAHIRLVFNSIGGFN